MIGRVSKRPMKLDSKTTFGIEVELSTPSTSSSVFDHLSSRNVRCQILNKSQVAPSGYWKITHDSSIRCSVDQPNGELVEIVSPVLCGGDGLSELHRGLQMLKSLSPSVNRSMGVHIHIGLDQFLFGGIRKICQQFVKHESSFDLMVPPSRRGNKNRYAMSNRMNPS